MPRQFAYDVSPKQNIVGTGVATEIRTDRFLHPPTLVVTGDFGGGSIDVLVAALRSSATANFAPFDVPITGPKAIILPVGYFVKISFTAVTSVDISIGGIAFSPWTDFTTSK